MKLFTHQGTKEQHPEDYKFGIRMNTIKLSSTFCLFHLLLWNNWTFISGNRNNAL